MLALAAAYAALGVSPVMRGALYGLGPAVLGIFVVALYRLGKSALGTRTHLLILVATVPSGPSSAAITAATMMSRCVRVRSATVPSR